MTGIARTALLGLIAAIGFTFATSAASAQAPSSPAPAATAVASSHKHVARMPLTGMPTLAKIRQNLGWAFGFNTLGIPLAAFGLLSPALAGAAMAFSSVAVLSNALLLSRWRARA